MRNKFKYLKHVAFNKTHDAVALRQRYPFKGGTMTVVAPNFVFVHVPKSAGRSITKVLGGETQGVPTHTPHHKLSDFGIDTRFSFGFVRNPWDRLVSVYAFMCQKRLQSFECPQYQQRIRDIGFKAWLLDDQFYMKQDEHWSDDALPPIQQRSQMFWLEGCDFIGTIENIDADFSRIRKQVGLKPSILERLRLVSPVPKKNTSQRGCYSRYFDDETNAFVLKHFHKEIRMFDYKYAS
ncbi:hypothetical protein GOZ78_22860 [Agrobacterium vitis]|uniref:Sulfotransferase family protein n=1 Tax=Agrobacterium vitis TaxID=373 RepID=A0ABD6GJS4_AGRVI|nr:sulfotransferase family 2 domain-containing protein [Agrobacterium vitis]MUP07796.1 hypothetical protein [Agrobacterium vitis]MUZ82459.1 hypothetical protein [Agrobacterium vitis]MVA12846.1 hypothetical protein [Agrobacterium vitis]MVA95120.1 hypothetical protein [Agrobacterium vitis]NSY12711.1 sulfotransferase family protein [Agrobacterium vitis]